MNNTILLFFISLVGAILGGFLSSYFKEKGKNLATKEDITDITNKIEGVKIAYAEDLEITKNELENHLKINSFRYEKEFSALVELTEAVYKFTVYAKEYGQIFLNTNAKSSGQSVNDDFANCYSSCYSELRLTAEKFRPFYSKEIYGLVLELDKVANSCAVSSECAAYNTSEKQGEYLNEAKIAARACTEKADEIVEAIRRRVESWEEVK